jgi:hypothetical protein
MSTGVDCRVFIDGSRIADGRDPDTGELVALSGLSVHWGRETTIDQPAASTCTFQISAEEQRISNRLRTGLTVDVIASAPIVTEAASVLPPLAPPTHLIADNAVFAVTGESLAMLPADATRRMSLTIAPAPLSTVIGVWDDIPTTSPGQSWLISAEILAPLYSVVTVSPVLFSSPNGARVTGAPIAVIDGDGLTHDVEGSFIPESSGQWVGVELSVWPIGPSWADLDPATTWAEMTRTWQDFVIVRAADIIVIAPEGGTFREVLVFAGRITDLAVEWDERLYGAAVTVTATDFIADLDNIRIGDEPWLAEPLGERFSRIIALAGYPVEAFISPTLTGTLVSWQDVDSQAATGLLQDLAQSVDGVMWSAAHRTTGAYIDVENPATRPPLYALSYSDGVVTIVQAAPDALALSACDVLRDPVSFVQDVADVATRVGVTWLEEELDEEGQTGTTERTETVIDDELEALYGFRSVHVGTMLQSADDARRIAEHILARLTFTGWRAQGLTIDDPESLQIPDADGAAMLLTLLDATARNGIGLRVTDLPEWSPSGAVSSLYLEGGTYRHTDGAWTLELTVSSASGLGQSVRWDELETGWRWTSFAPDVSWADLNGVGPLTPLGVR